MLVTIFFLRPTPSAPKADNNAPNHSNSEDVYSCGNSSSPPRPSSADLDRSSECHDEVGMKNACRRNISLPSMALTEFQEDRRASFRKPSRASSFTYRRSSDAGVSAFSTDRRAQYRRTARSSSFSGSYNRQSDESVGGEREQGRSWSTKGFFSYFHEEGGGRWGKPIEQIEGARLLKFEQHDQHLSDMLNMLKASRRTSRNGERIITNIANAAVAQDYMEVQRRASLTFDQRPGSMRKLDTAALALHRESPPAADNGSGDNNKCM